MPDWKFALASRLAPLRLRPARQAEIVDELAQHLDDRYTELVGGGATHEEAVAAALDEIEDDDLARSMSGLRQASAPVAPGAPARALIADTRQDIIYALRMLRAHPAFAAAAVLTLTLGIGANTAVFSLVDAALLRVLPVVEPERLVILQGVNPRDGSRFSGFSSPQFNHLRTHAAAAAETFAFARVDLNLSTGELTDSAAGLLVSDNYFSVLGVSPSPGRGFAPPDDAVAVLSHRFWRSRFAGDHAAVGRTVLVNGLPFTVIGVAPRRFSGTEVGRFPDVFVPLALCDRLFPSFPRLERPNSFWLSIMARVPRGADAAWSAEQVNAAYQRGIDEQFPGRLATFLRQRRIVLLPGAGGSRELSTQFRTPLLVLMTVVGLVLLIACANVANLLLARAAGRRRELAVRLALGAGRGRLVRQLMTESLTLSSAGGALGLLLALWMVRGLTAFFSNHVLDAGLDARVLGFTFATSALCGLLFGVPAAFRVSRTDLTPAFRGDAPPAAQGRRSRLGWVLVSVQVAISLLLLVGAGLFIRTLVNLRTMDPGFRADDVLVATINPGLSRYTTERTRSFFDELLRRVSVLPGVRSASLADAPLLGHVHIDGFSIKGSNQSAPTRVRVVGSQFFDTMGVTIRRGRDFSRDDREGSPHVAIINETIARTYFHGEDPLGRRIETDASRDVEIVGVVADAKYGALRDPVPNTIYLTLGQARSWSAERTLHVRADGDPAGLVAAVRDQVRMLDSQLPVKIALFSRLVDENLARERLVATLSGFFGGLALLLTALGLYGVITYSVQRRTREIGIRLSLGARGEAVVWMVLRDSLVPVAVGAVAGLLASLWLSRFVARQLFGVAPVDAATMAAAAVFLALIAAVAAYLPARRASRVDPMIALRDS